MCGTHEDIRTGAACPYVAGGVYAIKTVLDVWWQDDVQPPIVDSGRGFVTVIQKLTLSGSCDGSIGRAELQVCGLTLPPTMSWVMCDARQLEVPDAVWDSVTMPRLVTSGAVSAFDVGGVLTVAKASALIGISLTDADAPWPSMEDLLTGAGHRFLDHDGDDRLGIPLRFAKIGTAHRTTGCGLNGDQPVTFRGGRVDFHGACVEDECYPAAELDVGLRLQLGASGSILSCGGGDAAILGASSADSLSLAITSCVLNDGSSCAANEAEFLRAMVDPYSILDEGDAPPPAAMANPCDCPDGCAGPTCPLDQTPSRGPRSAMVRLGDARANAAFDCSAVRSAVETAFPGTAL